MWNESKKIPFAPDGSVVTEVSFSYHIGHSGGDASENGAWPFTSYQATGRGSPIVDLITSSASNVSILETCTSLAFFFVTRL